MKKEEKIIGYYAGYGIDIKVLSIEYGIDDKLKLLLDGKKHLTRVIKYDAEEGCEPYISLYGERLYLSDFLRIGSDWA